MIKLPEGLLVFCFVPKIGCCINFFKIVRWFLCANNSEWSNAAYQDYTVVEGINYGMSYFTPEKRFKTEKEFVSNFLLSLPDTLKRIYGLDIEHIELERTFDLLEFDQFTL